MDKRQRGSEGIYVPMHASDLGCNMNDYEDYFLLNEKQHIHEGCSPKDSVVVLDSYDGVQHTKNDKGNVSITSFSSKLLTVE